MVRLRAVVPRKDTAMAFVDLPRKGVSQGDAAALLSGEKSQGTIRYKTVMYQFPNLKRAAQTPRLSAAGTRTRTRAWRFERNCPRLWRRFLTQGDYARSLRHPRARSLRYSAGLLRTRQRRKPLAFVPQRLQPGLCHLQRPSGYERRAVPGARSAPSPSGV